MILIGQYDSPFVRRVGLALTFYDLSFEHRPWSVFGDADRIRPLNPLIRVPTFVLDDGFVLTDSHMMLDYLDSLVPADRAMFPRAEPARHRALKLATLGSGLGEKAVSLFYERRLHATTSDVWESRCKMQIAAVLDALETDRARTDSPYWFGTHVSHADIAVACALRFLAEAHPELVDWRLHPHLAAHAARLEALPEFKAIQQPFLPPA